MPIDSKSMTWTTSNEVPQMSVAGSEIPVIYKYVQNNTIASHSSSPTTQENFYYFYFISCFSAAFTITGQKYKE
jgi:hypothetical protein